MYRVIKLNDTIIFLLLPYHKTHDAQGPFEHHSKLATVAAGAKIYGHVLGMTNDS